MKACWLAMLVAATAAAADPAINWVASCDEALASARTNSQPVLLDFYATWCGWCRVMDREVYANPRVIELLRGYVCVKVDVDHDTKTALKYQISSLPRTILLDSQGEVAGDLLGYVEAARCIEFVAGIHSNPAALTATVIAGSPEKLIEYLGSPDPKSRGQAGAALVAAGEPAIPALAAALSSDHLGTRLAAHALLRKITGAEIEFDAWAAKPDRELAANRWRASREQRR